LSQLRQGAKKYRGLSAAIAAYVRAGFGSAFYLQLAQVRAIADEPGHFTSICNPSFAMMPANFFVSASMKAAYCSGEPASGRLGAGAS
jgi:hypothetical protein